MDPCKVVIIAAVISPDKTGTNAKPDLTNELVKNVDAYFQFQSLLDAHKKHRRNYCNFEESPEAHEEECHYQHLQVNIADVPARDCKDIEAHLVMRILSMVLSEDGPEHLLSYLRRTSGIIALDWNVTWVRANADGLAERLTLGINGKWPPPLLNITKGDRIIASIHNHLGNQSTSMHFHGMFQKGTNEMDGPVSVSRCEISPGESFTLNFIGDQPGTYWYHSHMRGQYPDGLRHQFIVHDPQNPVHGQFDVEIPITLSDWYHDEMSLLIHRFLNFRNPIGAEPVPNSALMNDTQDLMIHVEPGKTYLFRLTNVGAFAGQYFWVGGHSMRIIEVDGVYVEPTETEMIYVTAAQRYGFLVTTRNDSSINFPLMASMDTDLFDDMPDRLNWNVTGWLVYNDSTPNLPAVIKESFDPLDNAQLVPLDGIKTFQNPNLTITLNFAFFNQITYTAPKVPTLYSVLTTGEAASDVRIYGDYTNSLLIEKDQIVEIVLNNDDLGKHPFHLHGHNFQVIVRNFVIRFRADNPGVWLFHCHIDWHLISGLAATLIEAPRDIQEAISIPADHLRACRTSGQAQRGNAAANTEHLWDLTDQPKSPPPLPVGFAVKGVVALVFSCRGAILGLMMIIG
ncbi:multicopper oxidase [Piedraia hortae CBS 480.64]|uniref:Multicopper oxidase n=1 Tax=Piedraia hortae CBS 480.64 TaxID=1314780 RepID=A0A6A7BYT2_9PEZI|nr:multicopper oxidase [Piedraia hortae CBS 480.64]